MPLTRPTASATSLQLPLFIVSVSCLLVLSAATLRQKPAKPANSPRRTKCSTILNSLPFPAPCSRHYLLPYSLFPRGGSRNRPKIGQLFIGWGNYGDTINLPVVERQSSLPLASGFSSLPLATAWLRGPHSLKKLSPPHPTPFCRRLSLRHRLLGFKSG